VSPTAPHPQPSQVASSLAAELRKQPSVRSLTILQPANDRQGARLKVELDPDVGDHAITQLGELVSAAGTFGDHVNADFTAGAFHWNLAVGRDPDRNVSPLIWLRSDPRVVGADVDSLTAVGFTADDDVLDTIADYHSAMSVLDVRSDTRIEIRPPDASDGHPTPGLDVSLWSGKPFPSAAIAGVVGLRRALPTASVFLSLLEGHNELTSRVALPAGTDPTTAIAAVRDTIVPSVGADATRLDIGVVTGLLDAYTDAHLAYMAAMAAVPDLTGVGFSKTDVAIKVGTSAGWTAAQDVAAALGEPFRVTWQADDVSLYAAPIPASDPVRSLAPTIAALRSVSQVFADPGKLRVTVELHADPAELRAIVGELVAADAASSIEFSLQVDDGDDPVVVRITHGTLTRPEGGYDALIAPFVDAWHAQLG